MGDLIVISVLVLIVAFVIWRMVKNKKKGTSCSCGCSACANKSRCHPDE